MILVAVEDLFFLSKIQQTAKLLAIPVETAGLRQLKERTAKGQVSLVIVDLNHRSGAVLDVLRSIKNDPATSSVPVLGFVSHVQTELVEAARAVGCECVMARSAFSNQLPQLLEKFADKATEGEPES